MACLVKVAIVATVIVSASLAVPQSAADLKQAQTCVKGRLLNDNSGKVVWLTHQQLVTRAVKKVLPSNPFATGKQARITGKVSLNVVVNSHGKPECIWLLSGHPMLAPASIEAARQWEFKPEVVKGKRVGFAGTLTFTVENSVWSH